MRFVLFALLLTIGLNSFEQCDATFTYTHIDCDSVWFVPASMGSQYVYDWQFGDGNTSNDDTPVNLYGSDGSFTVMLTVYDTVANCSQSQTQVVIINCGTCSPPTPVWTYGPDSTNCGINFAATTTGGTPPYTYFWDFGDGNTSNAQSPHHTYVGPDTFTVCLTVTDANGCDSTDCFNVFSGCPTSSCDATFTYNFVDCDSIWFYSAAQGPQYTHYWDFDNGNFSSDANPTEVFANGVYDVWHVVYDNVSGCSDSTFLPLTVNCNYTPCTTDGDFAWFVDSMNCEVNFVSTAFGGTAPYSFHWNFGDGNTSNLANPTHQYPNNSNWTPCLTISDANGCDTTICYPISVNCAASSCNSTFTYNFIDCDSVWFYSAAQGPQYSHFWDFGNGDFSYDTNPTYVFQNGVYDIWHVVYDTVAGCSDSTYHPLTINCNYSPCTTVGDFNWSVDTTNCEVQFISTAFGGTAPYTFHWNFGDGNTSNAQHPVHQYPNNSVYTPCLTITDANGCDTTICQVVTTNCSPSSCNAQFTYSYTDCDSVFFIPSTLGGQYDYIWDFGNGQTSTNMYGNASYNSDGTYYVVLTIIDSIAGCSDSYTMPININCNYSPCTTNGAISWNVDSIDCSVQFVSTAFGGTPPYTYHWNFGDGNTANQPHPNHQYPNNTTWTPCLTITDSNGCDTTICEVVNVNCSPTSCDATISYAFMNCSDVQFASVNNGPNYSHYWDFGDGNTSTAQNPSHTYADGVYIVMHYVEDSLSGCTDSTLLTITVNCGNTCQVNGDWAYALDSNNCEVQFTSTAWGGQAPYSYFWNFGDGNTSTDAHPLHQFPANSTYTPCLTITDVNGCDTTICYQVDAFCTSNNCNASFSYTHVSCDSVWFIPDVQGSGYAYQWDFGDGNTSDDIAPIHTYGSNGTYTVILYLTDSINNCYDAYTAIVNVNCGASPCNVQGVTTWVQDSAACSVHMVSSVWGGQAPYTYYWIFGDSTTSNQAHPTHTYPNSGPWTPCLVVTDANGCDTTICMVVYPNCTASIDDTDWNGSIRIYPNPANGLFYLTSDTPAELSLFDLSGQLIVRSFHPGQSITKELDLSQFADGVYILKLRDETSVFTKKLIKK